MRTLGGYNRSLQLYSAPEVIKGTTKLAAPQEEDDQVKALRKAVNNADWGKFFAEKQTRTLASPYWAASEERCHQLRTLCKTTRAKRVLEIGSFVGVSTLSMALELPDDGEIVALEIDPFAADFGVDIKADMDAFWKISPMVGPAYESLQSLVDQMHEAEGTWEPFDLAVIDADKAGMMEYFEILTQIPGFMSDNYVLCVDMKPFKGQLSTQNLDKIDSWLISSGQTEIQALRELVTSSGEFDFVERGNLLQVCQKVSYTMANCPFAAFPNCYSNGEWYGKWAAPQVSDSVAELRKAVENTDWTSLFNEGSTEVLATASWSASEERCEKLQALCMESAAKNILEIGSFCGVASLTRAASLPHDGRVVSLEIDPFLVGFGQEIKNHSNAAHKIDHMVGPAVASLKTLASKAASTGPKSTPFDFVVIDADKTEIVEYFKILWETPGMLTEHATVCVDTTPFKCQLFVPYVKGKMDDWVVKSGQESIDAFLDFVRSLPGIDVDESSGLVVLRRRK